MRRIGWSEWHTENKEPVQTDWSGFRREEFFTQCSQWISTCPLGQPGTWALKPSVKSSNYAILGKLLMLGNSHLYNGEKHGASLQGCMYEMRLCVMVLGPELGFVRVSYYYFSLHCRLIPWLFKSDFREILQMILSAKLCFIFDKLRKKKIKFLNVWP